MFWEFGCIGVLGSELKYYNTCNSSSLVKYFSSVFTRECRLKVEQRNLWCPLLCLFFIFFQFHFSCDLSSLINFLTVVSELLVVFLESDTIHVKALFTYTVLFTYTILFTYTALFTYTILFIYTVLFTRNSGRDSRILRCKAGNSGVSKAIVWFCTCLGKLCHKGNKNLRSLSFKWDHCDSSNLSWELSGCAYSHILITIRGDTLVCVQYSWTKWRQSMKLRSSMGIIFRCEKWSWKLYWGKIIAWQQLEKGPWR